jgi:hypothetical protein
MKSHKKRKALLQRIINHQISTISFDKNLGLMNGKMGCAIFFFHYARYSKQLIYEDFAGELLDEIYEDISSETPIYFRNGLSGIAWGIEYLIHQEFVNGEPNEVLIDIDRKIMERDPLRITDYTLETGLEGIAWYILTRLLSKQNPFDAIYLNDFQQICKNTNFINQQKGIHLFLDYMEKGINNDPFFIIMNKITNVFSDELSWQKGLKMIIQ